MVCRPLYPFQGSLCLPFAQYHKVIGISYEPRSHLLLYLLYLPQGIQNVEIDVGKKRRDDPALGSAFVIPPVFLLPILPFFYHRRIQPYLYEFQDVLVYYALRYQFEKFVMGNGVEILGDVGIYYLGISLVQMKGYVLYRLMGVPLRSEPVGILLKVHLKDGFYDQLCCHLDYPVLYRWYPQWPLAFIALRDIHPPHRHGFVGLSFQFF